MKCASVRRKGSSEQCESAALVGHTLCGRHARCRVPVLWQMGKKHKAEKIQALARGWILRRRLAFAGPGVLNRKNLVNDEDLFTCDTKERQCPLDYFAFEEAGKVWWFGFSTFWQWCSRTHAPVNPYTKVPLSSETRQRLWENWAMRLRLRQPLPDEPMVYADRLQNRWNVLSQVFSGFGFDGVHPSNFTDMSRADYMSMFILLKPDLEMILPSADPFRTRVILLCSRNARATHTLQSVYALLVLMTIHRSPYSVAFSILSALLRC